MDSELSSPGPRTFQGITRTPCDSISSEKRKLRDVLVLRDSISDGDILRICFIPLFSDAHKSTLII